LGDFQPPGYFCRASSSDTAGTMMTSSPGFQFTGVATLCLAVSCIESSTRSHFVEVAAGGHRVNEHQLDLLVRTHHEHRAHVALVAAVRPSDVVPASAGSML